MKVILQKDVARIGRKFDVKEVSDGHALNFLIPRGLAERATLEAEQRLAAAADRIDAERAAGEAQFADMLAKLQETTPRISVEANEQGHLFRGLHVDDVARTLEQEGFAVRPDQVVLSAPIKELGTHEITLVSGDREGVCTVNVERSA